MNVTISVKTSQQLIAAPNQYKYGFETMRPENMKDLSCLISWHAWSPCIWMGGVRLQNNFSRASLCALDFDTPEMTLAEALRSFCDMKHVIGTTRNHQRDKRGIVCDRFRVVLLFDKEVRDLRTYRYNMSLMIKKYPIDRLCKDGARFFYPCFKIESVSEDGYEQDVIENVPEDFENKKNFLVEKCRNISPLPLKRAFLKRFHDLNRNNATYGVCKDLFALGYTKEQIFSLVTSWMSELDVSLHLQKDEVETIIHYLK